MKTTLIFDTASFASAIGLAQDGKAIVEDVMADTSHQAEHLLSRAEALLSGQGMGYQDLEAIAVNIGPGSFTGIRIGIAAARGIGLAADKPVQGVTGFDVIAQQMPNPKEAFCTVIDARREQYYIQRFSRSYETIDSPELIAKEDLEKIEMPIIGFLEEPVAAVIKAELPSLSFFSKVLQRKTIFPAAKPLYIRPVDAKLA